MSYPITTLALANSLRGALTDLHTRLARAQQELATGRHADLSLVVGHDVGRDISLGSSLADIQAITQTNKVVSARLDASQTTLSSIAADAQNLRSALLRALNDGRDRSEIVAQARLALGAFIGAINGTMAEGYVFAGVNIDTPPLVDYFAEPPASNKIALDDAFFAAFGFSQDDPAASSIAEADMESFLSTQLNELFLPQGWSEAWSNASNEPLQGRISLFKTINVSVTTNDPALRNLAMGYTALSDLALDKLSGPAGDAVIRAALQQIGAGVDGVTRLQSEAGVMQSNIETADNVMAVQRTMFLNQVSSIENVDAAEVASTVNSLMTQIETAYTLTSKIQQLSLAKYL